MFLPAFQVEPQTSSFEDSHLRGRSRVLTHYRPTDCCCDGNVMWRTPQVFRLFFCRTVLSWLKQPLSGLQCFGVMFCHGQEPQSGTAWLPCAVLPGDRRHLRHVEQHRELDLCAAQHRTSRPSRAAMSAVTRCCPSIRMRFPAESVPSFSFTVGLRHAMRYPMGYP